MKPLTTKQERANRLANFTTQVLPILMDEYEVWTPAKGAYVIKTGKDPESITYYPMADKIHVPDHTREKAPGRWIENGLEWIYSNLI